MNPGSPLLVVVCSRGLDKGQCLYRISEGAELLWTDSSHELGVLKN